MLKIKCRKNTKKWKTYAVRKICYTLLTFINWKTHFIFLQMNEKPNLSKSFNIKNLILYIIKIT